MAQQYSDPYGHTRPEIQHGYSEDSNASGKDQYVGNNDQARPYSQANYPIPQERMSSYDSLPEKSFARPPKAEADGTVRRSRFVGMAANGERPASQWTQGECAYFRRPIELAMLTEILWPFHAQVSMFRLKLPVGCENGEKRTEPAGERYANPR